MLCSPVALVAGKLLAVPGRRAGARAAVAATGSRASSAAGSAVGTPWCRLELALSVLLDRLGAFAAHSDAVDVHGYLALRATEWVSSRERAQLPGIEGVMSRDINITRIGGPAVGNPSSDSVRKHVLSPPKSRRLPIRCSLTGR